MTTKICVVVIGFVVFALLCFEAISAPTTPPSPRSLICIRHIVNFQTRLMMLLEDPASLTNYEEYFDLPLRREMQYILNRLRGFARDVAQADEWQRIAREFFRFHLVNVCVTQAREYAEAYSSYLQSLNDASPSSLMENCVGPAASHMTEMFNANFRVPELADPVLLYEIIRFTRLPVIVILSTSVVPCFRVLLRNNTCARYIQMAGGGVPANFRRAECAPRQNIINDMRNLNYAMSNMLNRRPPLYTYDIPDANRRLFPRNSELHEFLKATLRNLPENQDQVAQKIFDETSDHIIRIVVRELLTNFLTNEYFWLSCHPAYSREGYSVEANELTRRNYALYNELLSTLTRIRLYSPGLRTNFQMVRSLGVCLSEFRMGGGVVLRRLYDLASAHELASSTPASSARKASHTSTMEASYSVVNI